MKTKVCKICKLELPTAFFYKCRNSTYPNCKVCERKRRASSSTNLQEVDKIKRLMQTLSLEEFAKEYPPSVWEYTVERLKLDYPDRLADIEELDNSYY